MVVDTIGCWLVGWWRDGEPAGPDLPFGHPHQVLLERLGTSGHAEEDTKALTGHSPGRSVADPDP